MSRVSCEIAPSRKVLPRERAVVDLVVSLVIVRYDVQQQLLRKVSVTVTREVVHVSHPYLILHQAPNCATPQMLTALIGQDSNPRRQNIGGR